MQVIALVHNVDPRVVIYYAEDQRYPIWYKRWRENREIKWTDNLFHACVFTNQSELEAMYENIIKIGNGEYEEISKKVFWLNKAIGYGFTPDKETKQIQCTIEIRKISLDIVKGSELFGTLEH